MGYSKQNFESWCENIQEEYDYSHSLLLEFEQYYDENIGEKENLTEFMNMYYNS